MHTKTIDSKYYYHVIIIPDHNIIENYCNKVIITFKSWFPIFTWSI